jgi:hypothetical protein
MDALSRAIEFCTSEAELARRLSTLMGRDIRTGHIYYWKKNGFSKASRDDAIPAIEAVTDGAVRVEELCPEVEWQRDEAGTPTGYLTPLTQPPPQPQQAQA